MEQEGQGLLPMQVLTVRHHQEQADLGHPLGGTLPETPAFIMWQEGAEADGGLQQAEE